jgi:hypothetical protein
VDADADGVPDGCDICPGFDDSLDADADTVPDGCDVCAGFDDLLDADADGVPDGCDICAGFDDAIDTDVDGVPDGCDTCPGFNDSLDMDNDGIPDACDFCPNDPGNDADGDGVCATLDCDDSNGAAFAVPSEVSDVRFEVTPSGYLMTWTEQATFTGTGTVYDVYRGLLSDVRSSGSFSLGTCAADSVTAPAFEDTGLAVPPGEVMFFLVRAQNDCPSGTGSYGDANRDATAATSPTACN